MSLTTFALAVIFMITVFNTSVSRVPQQNRSMKTCYDAPTARRLIDQRSSTAVVGGVAISRRIVNHFWRGRE